MEFRLTPPPVPQLKEKDVVRQCRDLLQYRGYWCQRNPVGTFKTLSGSTVEFGPVGIPDYVAVHALYPAFFLEFKAPGKKLRPSQVSKFAELQFGYGLHAVMVDSKDGLDEWLNGYEARVKARFLAA